jgi:hypothetical protein
MSKIKEPFTMGKHDALQNEINEMMIAIKLHHIECAERHEKRELWDKAKSTVACPTWQNIIDLLNRSYREMNTCRYNPIKY